MTTQNAPQCCGQTLKVVKEGAVFFYRCPKCGKASQGKTPAEAALAWGKAGQTGTQQAANLPAIPAGPNDLQQWASSHMGELIKSSAAFLEKPTTSRMIQKNVKYIMRHPGLEKVWQSDEGKESIIEALEEALYIGATMPEMGSIVPYGTVAEFIPSVEAYNFALTTGQNAPFKWIAIECIHENDKVKRSRVNGSFQIEFEHIPNERGEVVAVAVYGYEKQRDIIIGDIYEKARLMEKAAAHSKSYQYYLHDQAAINAARSENQIKTENGREYIEKQIPKSGGGTWTKKVFLDELHNPYEGGDQPEMLKKAAGKSFFRPWMKVRNSIEAAGEWDQGELTDDEQVGAVIDKSLHRAKESVKPEPEHQAEQNIKDADFEVVEEPPRPQQEPSPIADEDRI